MKKFLALLMAALLVLTAVSAFAEEEPVDEYAAFFSGKTVPVDALKAIEQADTFPIVIANKGIDTNGDPELTFDIVNNTDKDMNFVYYSAIAYDDNGVILPLCDEYFIEENYESDVPANDTVTVYVPLPDGVDPAGVRMIVRGYNEAGNSRTYYNPAADEWMLEVRKMYGLRDMMTGLTVSEKADEIAANTAFLKITGMWLLEDTLYYRVENNTGADIENLTFYILGVDANGKAVNVDDPSEEGTAAALCVSNGMYVENLENGTARILNVGINGDPDAIAGAMAIVSDYTPYPAEGEDSAETVENPDAERWIEALEKLAVRALD